MIYLPCLSWQARTNSQRTHARTTMHVRKAKPTLMIDLQFTTSKTNNWLNYRHKSCYRNIIFIDFGDQICHFHIRDVISPIQEPRAKRMNALCMIQWENGKIFFSPSHQIRTTVISQTHISSFSKPNQYQNKHNAAHNHDIPNLQQVSKQLLLLVHFTP